MTESRGPGCGHCSRLVPREARPEPGAQRQARGPTCSSEIRRGPFCSGYLGFSGYLGAIGYGGNS